LGSGHRALFAPNQSSDLRDKNSGGDVSSVSASFATLSADQINSDVKALLHMLWVSDHVHVENASLVQTLNNLFGRDAHGRDKKFSTTVNDDADQLVEFAFGVVITRSKSASDDGGGATDQLCLASTTSDLRDEEIHTERGVFVS
jgi:hypothetical protein